MPTSDVIFNPSVPRRALVVDDEASVCAMLAAQLTSAGWDAAMAATMAEAASVIADRSQTIDMVFLDVRLPDGDGLELVPLIQDRRDRPDVAIITGYRDEDVLVRAIRMGVLDVLFKPLTLSDIAVALRRRAVRERRNLGLAYERFDRVDQEFATIRQELGDLRRLVNAISLDPPQHARGASA